ncbi:MAG TPA: Dyp-type peroxidase [Dermatophilaceae bacterium]|nr:Dyp-type peroxidase [Dermatophilaceae bacterium]
MVPDLQPEQPPAGVTRRGLLGALGLGVGGLAVGAAAGHAVATQGETTGGRTGGVTSEPGAVPAPGSTIEPFHGAHQAGVETPLQANATFVALDLRDDVDREALVRLMRLLTDDVERLSEGRPALADPQPELAVVPARLTATVGYGMGLLEAAGLADQAPAWLAGGLPAFSIDTLKKSWSGGDLLLQVAAEDPMTVSHAVRVLLNDAEPFATVRWVQSGFHRPANTAPTGITGRNLFGQVDGTVNPTPGTQDFADVVWLAAGAGTPAWLEGGSSVVVRRVAMDLRVWGGLDDMTKEDSIGRRLSDGAPLTGGTEFTAPDYEAVDNNGFLIIPPTAHMRLAHATGPSERILRRPYNYDDGIAADGTSVAGLVFVAYQADPAKQFVPIQERLAKSDVLNLWTTPIGSALFAVPGGVQPGQYIGQALLG